MPIKTLHLTNYYHPASGGIRTFYHALLEGAERLRRPMRLVVPGDENRVEERGEFTRIYHLKAPRSPVFDGRYRLILPHTFLLPSGNGLRSILRSEQPELVEICDKYSLCWLAGALRRGWIAGVPRPTLVGVSCERLDDNLRTYVTAAPAILRLSALYFGKLYAPLFDFHIAVSHYVSEELTAACPETATRLRVLPMGVHVEHLGPQHRDAELRLRLQRSTGGDAATSLLLYAGRLSPEKNLGLLVGMMESLANSTKPQPAAALLDFRRIADCWWREAGRWRVGYGNRRFTWEGRCVLWDKSGTVRSWRGCWPAWTSSCIQILRSRLASARSKPWHVGRRSSPRMQEGYLNTPIQPAPGSPSLLAGTLPARWSMSCRILHKRAPKMNKRGQWRCGTPGKR